MLRLFEWIGSKDGMLLAVRKSPFHGRQEDVAEVPRLSRMARMEALQARVAAAQRGPPCASATNGPWPATIKRSMLQFGENAVIVKPFFLTASLEVSFPQRLQHLKA